MTDKEHIRQLLDKYIRGEYTQEEFDELLRHSTANEGEQTIGDLIEQYLADRGTGDQSQADRLNKILSHTDRKIREAVPLPDHAEDHQPDTRRRFRLGWVAVAATLIAVLSISVYYWRSAPVQTITITAQGTQTQQIDLPDGSQVWLNAGTTITYPERFSEDKRMITLSDGQAYFEVARDKSKPFTVDADDFKVEVLGTSFEVTTYKGIDQASVAVQTGKVNVSTGPGGSTTGTTLTANRKATINVTTGTLETTEIDSDDIAGWKENKLVFSGDDFATVIEALQRKYSIQIELKKSALLKEKITLRLDDQPVQTAIEILSISSNFNYEFANDSTVVIR